MDTRLELEKCILGDEVTGRMTSDGLWQLRLLFAWLDGAGREQQVAAVHGVAGDNTRSVWLRREVIEGLKCRVWRLAGGGEGAGHMDQ